MTNVQLAYKMKAMPIFANLRNREIALLSMVVKEEEVTSGGVIFREGDAAGCCYFVSRGIVDVVREMDNGEQTAIAEVTNNQLFGQVALLDAGPRSATCIARTPCELLRLDRSDFEMLFQSGSSFAFKFQLMIARVAAHQLREANQRLMSLLNQGRMDSSEFEEVRSILSRTDFKFPQSM